MPPSDTTDLTALGVFIFAGGFTVGVKRAGFRVLAHLEGNGYGVSSAQLNWPELPVHVGYDAWPLAELAGRVDFLYANPPCAIFSSMGIATTRGKGAWKTDPRTDCWHRTFGAVETIRPRAFAIESVCQAYTTGRELIDELTKKALLLGYSVTHLFVNARWHGLPQSRNRFFLVGHRPNRLAGLSLNWAPSPTIREVFAEIPDPGPRHDMPLTSSIDYRGLATRTEPGGRLSETFTREMSMTTVRYTPQGKIRGRPSFNYTRLRLDRGTGAFTGNWWVHPTETRWLGFNEMKAICGYPLDFRLDGPVHGYASLLSRAVMPPVAEFLAQAIRATFGESDGSWTDRTVTRVDLREPERASVDLTREYLNERDRVRFRVRAPTQTVLEEPTSDLELPRERPKLTVSALNQPPKERVSLVASDEPPAPSEGSGKFIRRVWLTGRYSPSEIVALVHRFFPGRKTTVADVSWNYHRLLRDGIANVPPWSSRPDRPLVEPTSVEPTKADVTTPRERSTPVRVPKVLAPVVRGPERVERGLLYLTNLADRSRTDPISSHRVAWYVEDRVRPDVVWHQGNVRGLELPRRVTELWAVASSWLHLVPPWRDFVQALYPAADRVIFCSNDYKGTIGSYQEGRLRDDAHYVTLTTVRRALEKRPGAFVNWNVLTYNPTFVPPGRPRDPRLLYYGTLRPGRERVFGRYLTGLADVLVISATKSREAQLYAERYPGIEVRGRLADLFTDLGGFAATLLLEDEYATRHYCSPPNRFYEALSTGTAMIFDRASIPNFSQAGYDVRPYAASTPAEVRALLARAPELAAEQARLWRRDYLGELDQQFDQALERLRSGVIGRTGPVPGLKRYADETYHRVWGEGP